jgi:hypothetical protein
MAYEREPLSMQELLKPTLNQVCTTCKKLFEIDTFESNSPARVVVQMQANLQIPARAVYGDCNRLPLLLRKNVYRRLRLIVHQHQA